MQTTFKVEISRDPEVFEERPFIPRRIHKKSRGGCSACKKRRIKCDETQPQCGKCTKTNTECIYQPLPRKSPKMLAVDESISAPLNANMYSMCINVAETHLGGLLSVTSGLDASKLPSGNIHILQHFQSFTSLTLGGSSCQTIFHSVIAKKAWERSNPYLMHMVLAVSCAHLKRLHADPSRTKLYQQYSMAEASYWQTGLQLYQKLLQSGSPNDNDQSGNDETARSLKTTHAAKDESDEEAIASTRRGSTDNFKPDFDATLATTFLTIIFTFALDDDIPQDAYADDDQEKFRHAINPLAATGGFRALRDIFGDDVQESCWKEVLIGSDDHKGTFSNADQPGVDGLPPAFVDLCGLDEHSNSENSEYHQIVRLLTPLLRLDHDRNNFTKLIAFSGRTWPCFRPLLYRRDPRGLLLLSYWFALLRQLDQWWLTYRAKTECVALVNYLYQLEDPKITALLPFPASFGDSDLSCLWDYPNTGADSSTIFEEYFQKAHPRKTLP